MISVGIIAVFVRQEGASLRLTIKIPILAGQNP